MWAAPPLKAEGFINHMQEIASVIYKPASDVSGGIGGGIFESR
jgi:hypothetical protein